MKPGNDITGYATGESMDRSGDNAGAIVGVSLAATVALAFGAVALWAPEKIVGPSPEELQAEALNALRDLSVVEFAGGSLEFNGPNSVVHDSDTTDMVYDFSQNTAEKRFSSYEYRGFGGGGAGGLGFIHFQDIPNIDAIERESCALAQTIKAHFEENAINYSFERRAYNDANAFLANHQLEHCTP